MVRSCAALLVGAILTASGCATDRATGYCSVHTVGNDLATPLGLVRLYSALEAELRAQLPPETRSRYLCWYTSRQDIVVSHRRDARLSNVAYTFTAREGQWKLSDDPPVILSLPRVIQ
jgi:hypothetical protein